MTKDNVNDNVNVNANANDNVNVNDNANANVNVNDNVNDNANANANDNDAATVFAENAKLADFESKEDSLRSEIARLKNANTLRGLAIRGAVRNVFECVFIALGFVIVGYIGYRIVSAPVTPENCYVRTNDITTSIYTVEAPGVGEIASYINPEHAAAAAKRCRGEGDAACTVRPSHHMKVQRAYVLYGHIPWDKDPVVGVALTYARLMILAVQANCALGPQ